MIGCFYIKEKKYMYNDYDIEFRCKSVERFALMDVNLLKLHYFIMKRNTIKISIFKNSFSLHTFHW